jgi:hypothetical protein
MVIETPSPHRRSATFRTRDGNSAWAAAEGLLPITEGFTAPGYVPTQVVGGISYSVRSPSRHPFSAPRPHVGRQLFEDYLGNSNAKHALTQTPQVDAHISPTSRHPQVPATLPNTHISSDSAHPQVLPNTHISADTAHPQVLPNTHISADMAHPQVFANSGYPQVPASYAHPQVSTDNMHQQMYSEHTRQQASTANAHQQVSANNMHLQVSDTVSPQAFFAYSSLLTYIAGVLVPSNTSGRAYIYSGSCSHTL